MIEIRKLSSLSFDKALELWNLGFEGYIYDSQMGLDPFIQRFGNEGLMPSLSIAAYVDGEPAGLVLNGMRTVNGKKIGWNGGTGVAVKFRRHGVGQAMIQASLDLYKENDMDEAVLEAAKPNEPAIALYKKMGYELIDELAFLQFEGALSEDVFGGEVFGYRTEKGTALDAMQIPFYNDSVPWQTHWQSLRRDGELLTILDHDEAVGYFLYRRAMTPDGKLASIILFSSGVKPGRKDKDDISRLGLRTIFSPLEADCKRLTFNYPKENKEVIIALEKEGFKPVTEQVFMTKKLK
ncbi:MAG: GNAT family N-acetyltransferase [Tuberibacillus sp.]